MDLDSHYINPKLTRLYDLDSGWSKDREFYLSLGKDRKNILDLGCGTGLLAEQFAKIGSKVTAVDPASEMLLIGREKRDHPNIEWVQSSVQEFQYNKKFDLIIMTGHAFQVLMTESDLTLALRTMNEHLDSNGLIFFESRNPNVEWDKVWNYDIVLSLPDCEVHELRRFKCWKQDIMHFEFNFIFPDEVIKTQSKLRFWRKEEIERSIGSSGLRVESLFGAWNASEFDENISEEMIFMLRPH